MELPSYFINLMLTNYIQNKIKISYKSAIKGPYDLCYYMADLLLIFQHKITKLPKKSERDDLAY